MAERGAWRPMQAGDLAAVAAISDAVHGAWTEPVAVYAERLAFWPEGCRVLEVDGAVAGYLIAHPWRRDSPPKLGALLGAIPADADSWYLHDIALLPAARGTGAAGEALRFVIDSARASDFGEVILTAVGGADRFWAAQGFAYLPRAADPSYGADAHCMRMAI